MKKLLLIICMLCMLLFLSCKKAETLGNETELSDISVTTTQEISASPAGIQPPLIKVNGVSYRLQSIASEDDVTEYLSDENYLGIITQDVNETQLPEEDLTSNCGLVGMSLYYMNASTIIVKIPSERNIWKPQNYNHTYIYYYCCLENMD